MIGIVGYLIVAAFITEAITKIIVSSYICLPIRIFIAKKSEFYGVLLSCGYCFSFWVSLLCNLAAICLDCAPALLPNTYLNLFILVILVHRFSNMTHGAIDRYFDTEKDIRYNKNQ